MSSKLKVIDSMKENIVSSVEIMTYVHATEDESKVVRALEKLIPSNYRSLIKIEKSCSYGHYGNEIKIIKIKVQNNELASNVISHVVSMLDNLDKQIIKASFEIRFEKSKLYLRINKQSLYLSKPHLDEGDDVVKIVIGLNKQKIKNLSSDKLLKELGID
ncbi:MAG: hypothetical protein B6V02_03485 [Thermoprotei archaeon ex4572_64]|nr:MAG: hypothetical protein B6V02_03485 [Thermoprotei archaeon ex4572_64]